jgi:hypothetical protein
VGANVDFIAVIKLLGKALGMNFFNSGAVFGISGGDLLSEYRY